MRKILGVELYKYALALLVCFGIFFVTSTQVYAKEENVILDGIYIDNLELSGLTKEEAKKKVTDFVEEIKTRTVTFGAPQDHYVAVIAGEIGLKWENPEVIDEACELGKGGNIVKRYKAVQDLKYGNRVYPLELSFDQEAIRIILEEQCAEYNVAAVNTSLFREDGEFRVIEGQTGLAVDVDSSLQRINEYLTTQWDYRDAAIDLVVTATQPKGSAEELAKVRDVLGKYTTDYSTSSSARCKNVENGCSKLNGVTLYPGEELSVCDTMKPFTEANGYYPAGAYLNGKVVESVGGGICQVSTTLYNALLLSEIEITQRSSHSMIVTYVEPSMDAAIAENGGKDLKFRNNLDAPIYIEGYTSGKKITFVVYGVETRDASHKVEYKSEVLSVTNPAADEIIQNAGQPIGYLDVQAAHIGYTAQLWKIVTDNGVETSREVINKSTYKASPRTATVGIATDNPVYAARIQNAVATGSIDAVKAEINAMKAEVAAIQALIEAQNQQQIVEELP